MKKIIALTLCVCISLLVFCACSETETFKASGFSSYIKLGDYKGLTVDKNSEDYKDYFNKMHLNKIAQANCYVKSEEGKVEFGDVANIDYVGTVDGVAFNGGTDNGYDLTIGSGKFIEGFEEGLIGVAVGETVDLNLTFPDSYENAELAGRNTVFKVKVNYRNVPKPKEEAYEELGYKSLEEYVAALDKECIANMVTKEFLNTCTYKKEPDVKNFRAVVLLAYYNSLCLNGYGSDIETYLSENGKTPNEFVEGIIDNIADNAFETNNDMKNVRKSILGYYAVCDNENITCPKKELGDSEGYERCYKESVYFEQKAIEVLTKNAKIIERE